MGERRGTKGLELWCKKMTQGYPGVKIDNMTTSWRDGLAFCAIIHHFRPELIDFDKLNKDDVYRNNELAFRVAEQYLGIPALLEAEDMVEYPVPDRLSILTYLSQFYQAFEVSHGSQSRAVPKRPASSVPDRGIVSPASTSPPTKMAIRSTGGVTVGMPRRDPCAKCGLPVFIAERLNVGKLLYHRTCFRCARCNSQLTLANYYETETSNQFCCETCPDEVVATETTSKKDVNILLSNEKPIVGRSLSDEEKSMLSTDQQHFVTALDFPDVSGSDEFTRARSFFMSAQLDEDEDDHPPDLPKSKPPDTVQFKDNSESNDSGLLSTNSSVNSVKDHVVDDGKSSSSINSVKYFGDDKVVTKEPPPVTPTSASLVQARMSIFESSSTLPTSNADDSVLESSPSQHDESVVLVSNNSPAVISDDSLTNAMGDDSVFESSPSLNKRQEMRLESPKATPRKKYQQDIKPSPPEEQPPKRPSTLLYESKRDNNIPAKRPATMIQSSKQSPQQEKLFFGEVKLRKTPPEKRATTPPKEDTSPEIKLKPMLKIDSIKRLEEAEQKTKLEDPLPVTLTVKDTNAITEETTDNSNRLMEENKQLYNNDEELEEEVEDCENNVDSLFENLLETSLEKDFNKLADSCLDKDEFALDDDFERLVQSLDKPVKMKVKDSELIKKKDQEVIVEKSNLVDNVKSEENVAQVQMDVNKVDEDVNIDKIEKCKEQEYPGDLNPFGEDEASLNPFGDDDVADEEVADNDKSLNPFSDDEDDDEQMNEVISPAKSTNPFEDDDDEEQQEEEIFKKPNPTARKLIPAPRISLPQFWNNEQKISGGDQQRGECSSFGSSTSISSGASSAQSTRRKKAAPRPPISNLLDQSSPQQSRPRDSSPTPSVQNSPRPRKSKRAPAPPTSTPAANHKLLSPSDISPINESTLIHSNSKSMTLEADEYEREKDVKDERNRTRQSCDSSNQSSFGIPNKSTYGKWKRKKGQAPSRPIPQKRSIKALPMTEVRRELGIIEVQQQGLEKQGVRLEQIIREKCEGPNSDAESAVSIEAEDLILQLFEVVNEKNELCRRQAELMYLQRQQRLEEEHAEIEYQIRCLMLQPEANKTDTDKAREEELILRLVDIVERRNEIIECLEMDRVREAEEDDSICNSMNTYATKRDENVLINSNESPKKKEKKKFRKKFKLKSSLSSSPKIDMDKDVDECEPSEAVVKDKKKKKFNLF